MAMRMMALHWDMNALHGCHASGISLVCGLAVPLHDSPTILRVLLL
jgi:hypothetical protein